MLWKEICVGLFLTFSPVIIAQQLVSGRITDATDGTPVVGASVYVAHTTVGTASDASGNYSLTVPGRGSFEIVVSHVGYQTVSHKVDTPKNAHQFNVALETHELEELVVNATKTYRQRDVDLFWRNILGEIPSRRRMEVLNPEKVYYYLNSDRVLKVSCREPIEIINHQLGYRILYVIQSFEHDYRTDATTFRGMPYFEELVPQNDREKERWETERQEVYAVSLNRFLRALYVGDIHKEGFLLIYAEPPKDLVLGGDTLKANKKREFVILEDMLQADQDMVRVNIEELLLLVCYAEPITTKMIQNSNWRNILRGNETLVELRPQQISVYSDGTYSGLLTISEINGSISGLSSKVPVEYPEIAGFAE